MGRNPKLEALLAARWDAEQCAPIDKPAKLDLLRCLAQQALSDAGADTGRWHELLAATETEYRAFRAERLKEEMRRLSRLR